MKGKWLRRGMVLGLAAAFGSLCGCGIASRSPSAVVFTEATEPSKPQPVQLAFPHTLPDSTLVAEELVSYYGQYWEDGSGDMVEDVAGLMLYNPTDRMIEFGAIALEQAGEQLYFFVYQFPPMSRCLILERDRKPCRAQEVTACRELCVRWDHQEISREELDYVGLGPMLTIVNRDSRRQDHVTLWYKQYEKEGDYYMGGAAYSAHVFFLQPEERRTITPEHYYAGSAKIVAIKLET